MWQLPRGQVRNGFVETVDRLYTAAHGGSLKQAQRTRLAGQADRQFATALENSAPDAQALDLAWRLVFR